MRPEYILYKEESVVSVTKIHGKLRNINRLDDGNNKHRGLFNFSQFSTITELSPSYLRSGNPISSFPTPQTNNLNTI